MHDEDNRLPTDNSVWGRIYRAIAITSQYIAYAAIAVMLVVMVVEVVMRYIVSNSLGWNISLFENVLMPALAFLALPWAYATGAHVASGMVYDRLGNKTKSILDVASSALLIVCMLFLVFAGATAAVEAFTQGFAPPPLSAQVSVPSWVWKSFLPIGAAGTAALVAIDVICFRTLRKDLS